MEKDNSSKLMMILMVCCVVLSFVTLGIVCYDKFIRKEPEKTILKPVENTNQGEKKFSKLEKVSLNEKSVNVTINKQNISVKFVSEDGLYINNKKIVNEFYSSNFVYVTDYFVIAVDFGQGGEIYSFFDETGNEMLLNDNGQYRDLKIENGNLVAQKLKNIECIEDENEKCDQTSQKVQFVYDGLSLIVKNI